MKPLIAGTPEPARAILARLASQGVEADTSTPEGSGAAPEGVEALAASLLGLERRMIAEAPPAVVLADGSDHALAAALVATKLLVPVVRLDDSERAELAENESLLGLLAETIRVDALPTLLRQ